MSFRVLAMWTHIPIRRLARPARLPRINMETQLTRLLGTPLKALFCSNESVRFPPAHADCVPEDPITEKTQAQEYAFGAWPVVEI